MCSLCSSFINVPRNINIRLNIVKKDWSKCWLDMKDSEKGRLRILKRGGTNWARKLKLITISWRICQSFVGIQNENNWKSNQSFPTKWKRDGIVLVLRLCRSKWHFQTKKRRFDFTSHYVDISLLLCIDYDQIHTLFNVDANQMYSEFHGAVKSVDNSKNRLSDLLKWWNAIAK